MQMSRFELCPVKSKRINNVFDIESRASSKRDSYKKETVYFLRGSVFLIQCKYNIGSYLYIEFEF